MSIEPQTPAKTLTQMVATQIKLQMVLADDIKQSQLARKMGRTEQWLSVRLRGKQPIDLNDLALIAGALGVGVHELLPPPDLAAEARADFKDPYILLGRSADAMRGAGDALTPTGRGSRRDSTRPPSSARRVTTRPAGARPTVRPRAA